MSDLRDARLKKALDQAPDGDAGPSEAVREAILHKARLTAAAAAPRRAAWISSFSRPWNSVLATVGVVAFVGVLVWNQGLLQQHPEEPAPVAAPKAVAPTPPASVALVPQAPMAEAKSALQERQRVVRPPVPHMPAATPVPVPQPTVSAQLESMPSEDRAAPAAPAAPPPPPLAYAPAPVMSARAAPEQRSEVTVSGSAVVQAWTALRLSARDGPVLLQREQLPAGVSELLVKVLRSPVREETVSGALTQSLSDSTALRLELMLGEQVVGRLEFSPNELRWTPAGQPTRVLRPAELAELRKALEAAIPTVPAK